MNNPTIEAHIVLGSINLHEDLSFYTDLGFRLDQIYPSDDPTVALINGFGMHIRLDKSVTPTASTIHLVTDDIDFFANKKLVAPNLVTFVIAPKTYQLSIPKTKHQFEVRHLRNNDSWVIGRAGMLYRDLIPNRLGGSIIASHIHIPNGGPVPDMVHYHTIGFQLIFCYKGWVKLVYEDQGEPFILNAGDCVTQPPEIRHQVLEASDNLEVIEIGVPAEHMTTIDHEIELPTKNFRPERLFGGQRFCHHQLKNAIWEPWHFSGFEFRDTKIKNATNQMANVTVIRTNQSNEKTGVFSHNADILFSFVMNGQLTLKADDYEEKVLNAGDAFVIPPMLPFQFEKTSANLELLEVGLKGNFTITKH